MIENAKAVSFVYEPAFPLFLAAVFVLLVVGSGMYVMATARRSAEAHVVDLVGNLNAAREKLSEAEKIGHFGSFTWDFEEPRASFWSEEMYALCGLVPRERIPASDVFVQVAHEKDKEETRIVWERALKQPGPFNFVFRAVDPTGKMRYLRITGTTTLDADKRTARVKGVAHDVTKEMEVDQAKSEFVSLASHQLKTPLTSIRWMSEGLLGGGAGVLLPEQLKQVTEIHEASTRMMEMVNDLLNVSRIELHTLEMKPEEMDICELLASVVHEQQHTADRKHVEVRTICGSEVPRVFVDKNFTRMIFQNLISNAIKYTPEKGHVDCEITVGGIKKEKLFIRVSDTGIGIPKSEQSRVFEKLHRATNAEALVPDGTGLGLYVVKIIVDRAGGEITFESKEGKGTTFYISVPLHWSGAGEKKN